MPSDPVDPPRPASELAQSVIARGYRLRRRYRLQRALPGVVAAVAVAGVVAALTFDDGGSEDVAAPPEPTTSTSTAVGPGPTAGTTGTTSGTTATAPAGPGPGPAPGAVPVGGETGELPVTPAGVTPRRATTLAFERHGDDGSVHIGLLPAGATEARMLTTGDSVNQEPALSPDGTQIAFASDRGNALRRVATALDIYVMNADGTGVRRLSTEPVGIGDNNTAPTWSPDGRWIAFAGTDILDEVRVYVVPVAGGVPIPISPAGARYPSWSPDGARIAYYTATGDDLQLWRHDLMSGVASRLGSTTTGIVGPIGWSSDGSQYVRARSTEAGPEVVITGVDAVDERVVTVPGYAYQPVWCGDQLLFVHDPDGLAADTRAPTGPAPSQLVVAGVDGSNPTAVLAAPDGGYDLHPTCTH